MMIHHNNSNQNNIRRPFNQTYSTNSQLNRKIQGPRITTKTKYAISFLCLFDGLRTPSIRRLVRKPNIICGKSLLTFDPSYYAPSSKSALQDIYQQSLNLPCEISVDPSVQTVLTLLRRHTSSMPPQRVILHYCGFGVLQPNTDGCLFFFTDDRQRYKPLKIQNIANACGCPLCFIIDCGNSGALKKQLLGRQDLFAFFSCSQGESLPLSMDAPLDIFSSCLLRPYETALEFHKSSMQHNPVFTEQLMPIEEQNEFLLRLFNSILDAIICETQGGSKIYQEILVSIKENPKNKKFIKKHNELLAKLEQKSHTQFTNMLSPSIAALTRGYALANRVMTSFNLHPTSIPELKPMASSPLWEFWDLVLDFALTVQDKREMEKIVFNLFIESFKKFPRISHIPIFSIWFEKEEFQEEASRTLLSFLEAVDIKKPSQQSETQRQVRSVSFNENDMATEIRFYNTNFFSYSDFDEYEEKDNDINQVISNSSDFDEEEDAETLPSDSDDSIDEKASDCENIFCSNVILGKKHFPGMRLSLLRSKIVSFSSITPEIFKMPKQSKFSLMILAKLFAASSLNQTEDQLQSLSMQQAPLNFATLRDNEEIKAAMLATCCMMNNHDIPSSFNRLTQICIEHAEDCAPYSLILFALLLENGGKLVYSTAESVLVSLNTNERMKINTSKLEIEISNADDESFEESKDENTEEEPVRRLIYDKFESFLHSPRSDIRASALFLIGESKEPSIRTMQTIMSIFEDEKEEEIVKSQALLALANLEIAYLKYQLSNGVQSDERRTFFTNEFNDRILKVINIEKNKKKIDRNLIIKAYDLVNNVIHIDSFNHNSQNAMSQFQQQRQIHINNIPHVKNPILDYLVQCVSSEGFFEVVDTNIFKHLDV